jgi:hypothetical protein
MKQRGKSHISTKHVLPLNPLQLNKLLSHWMTGFGVGGSRVMVGEAQTQIPFGNDNKKGKCNGNCKSCDSRILQ